MLANFKQFNRQKRTKAKQAGTLLLLSLAVGLSGPDLTWSETSSLDETVRQDFSMAHTTQHREEAWDKERIALEAKISRLTSTREKMQETVDGLLWVNGRKEKASAGLREEISKATNLTEGLSPVIAEEAQRAREVVNKSLPFLKKERTQRLAALDQWTQAPATKQAEKLERLLELLTIETQYGHTSEAWQEEIEVDGAPITAELLTVGRLALFYLTLDEKSCGAFNPKTKAFEALPNNSATHLKKAIALARRERSAELVSLPIGRIVVP
ncbi:DUF3450 family protein [Desulfoluna sp.]|uniref:DUF3450 family protein n=1 Tax=Desulfoluna sp. TaxID=2045199 RepID=UPI0026306F7D|nr:DUF3450 family protein [Desulfoluna sp.]